MARQIGDYGGQFDWSKVQSSQSVCNGGSNTKSYWLDRWPPCRKFRADSCAVKCVRIQAPCLTCETDSQANSVLDRRARRVIRVVSIWYCYLWKAIAQLRWKVYSAVFLSIQCISETVCNATHIRTFAPRAVACLLYVVSSHPWAVVSSVVPKR